MTKKQLGKLAARTKRTRSFLAGEAISAYVKRETGIIEGIEQGRKEAAQGHVVPHDEAMRQLRKSIEAVAKKRK